MFKKCLLALQLADGTPVPVKVFIALPLSTDDWQADYKFVTADTVFLMKRLLDLISWEN